MKNHKKNCQCGVCKAIRGEYQGKNSPTWKGKIKKLCLVCNKKFEIYPSIDKKEYGKFCSHKCYGIFLKGKHINPQTEFKKGMTSWLKGKHVQCNSGRTHFKKGMFPWNKDKHPEQLSGKNHWNWQNGKSFEEYPQEFNEQLKETIRDRDNHKCQLCNKPEVENMRKLDVHHIDYNKENCDETNLISLCQKCNLIVNYNRNYWINYFQNKVGVL